MKPARLGAMLLFAALCAPSANAKLPPPNEQAQKNAAAGALQSAYAAKLAAYQLCVAQDRVAETYLAAALEAGKPVQPSLPTGTCTQPGPPPKSR